MSNNKIEKLLETIINEKNYIPRDSLIKFFEHIGTDTNRYRIEYLAETIGYFPFREGSYFRRATPNLNETELLHDETLFELHMPELGVVLELSFELLQNLNESSITEKFVNPIDWLSRKLDNTKIGKKIEDIEDVAIMPLIKKYRDWNENIRIPRQIEKNLKKGKDILQQDQGIFKNYHASTQSKPINFVPKLPPTAGWQNWRKEQGYTKTQNSLESDTIPRICVANDPKQCGLHMGGRNSIGDYIYIHEPDDPSEINPAEDITPTREIIKHVPNAGVSGEYWINKPFRSMPIGHFKKTLLSKIVDSDDEYLPRTDLPLNVKWVPYTPKYYDKQIKKLTKKDENFPSSYEGLLNRYGKIRALKRSGKEVDESEMSDLRSKIISMEKEQEELDVPQNQEELNTTQANNQDLSEAQEFEVINRPKDGFLDDVVDRLYRILFNKEPIINNKKKFLHLSPSNKPINFVPRVPTQNRFEEDKTIPRVCVTDSVGNCIKGSPYTRVNSETPVMYVHEPMNPDEIKNYMSYSKVKKLTPNPFSRLSGEYWVTQPYKSKVVGEVKQRETITKDGKLFKTYNPEDFVRYEEPILYSEDTPDEETQVDNENQAETVKESFQDIVYRLSR